MQNASVITPILTGSTSQANISDQGYTYNQTGMSYNEAGIAYGGAYGYADVRPIISLAVNVIPSIFSYADIYTPAPIPGSNQSIGPGFFLYITH